MVTLSWYAELAFRRRVSMSAMGSVMVIGLVRPSSSWSPARWARGLRRSPSWGSPGALGDAGQLAAVRHLAHADPAQAELAVHRVGAPAALAAGVGAHRELRLAGRLDDQRGLGHVSSP